MALKAPMVSVVIPVYNGAHCIGRAIDSVLCQTFSDFEVVIVDDGSSDDSIVIIKGIADRDPNRIRYFVKENEGPGRALEYGVIQSRGRFVAFLDQDDCWFRNKLERQVLEFMANPNLGLVSTDHCRGIDPVEEGESVLQWMKYPEKTLFERLLLENPICSPSVLVRKDVLDDVKFCGKAVSYGSWDRPLWVKIAHKYEIKILNEILMWKYDNESTLSHQKNYCESQFEGWKYLLSYFDNLSEKHKNMIRRNCADTLYQAALYYFWKDDYPRFKNDMLQSCRYDLRYITRKPYFPFLLLPNHLLSLLKRAKRSVRRLLDTSNTVTNA